MYINDIRTALIIFWFARCPAHSFEDHSQYDKGDQEADAAVLKGERTICIGHNPVPGIQQFNGFFKCGSRNLRCSVYPLE